MNQTQESATDIWVYLSQNKESFINHLYASNPSAQATLPALSVLLRGVSLWGDFFLRYASALSIAYLPSHLLPCIDPKRYATVCDYVTCLCLAPIDLVIRLFAEPLQRIRPPRC
ncbi:hypothetical protein EON64_08690 [archaeon]|nr:MAG: hypothetical protein EON64_08690 [archaeon]